MFGRCLVRRAEETGDDDMLFTAVNQINLAGRAVISNADECYAMANYNLIAGKRAMASSAFSVAYSLLDHGIGFLGNDYWQTHYKFSLTLYELASQSALAAADINGLNCLREEVMKHAKCPEDKLNIQYSVHSFIVTRPLIKRNCRIGMWSCSCIKSWIRYS
jgi:predicted ATPase